ncbi:uncharacterized protein N7498_011020 [Penicillium cinerascens]|uniref:Sodium/calcium exchanger membrane region domain-containing protein n=1 Tax=Penicillium cinerascens TaxID=70096 RepID=A0A9W9J7Y8_9EURO|nr:uncharacterized protein N7498_011020 [Penicillium cinerascens]KAJ5192035.1 hypothetical protein N7498_011020 [Penicillium cinerascens]
MAIRQPRGDSHYNLLSKEARIKFTFCVAVVISLAVTFAGINALRSSASWAAHGAEEVFHSNKPDGQTICRDVKHASNQCDFVKQFCQSDDDGLISYFGLYYCSLQNYQVASWLLITTWSIFLFLTIGICAGDFFTVNLSCISRQLNLSDTFAGVTFLAVGNSGADIFSTWAAMTSDNPEMAIGELVGSASFITTVTAGSIAFMAPFTVRKVSLVRDAVFLLVTVSFALVLLSNQEFHLWEGVLMIVLYVVYMTGVMGYHWWTSHNSGISVTGHSESRRPDEERQIHNGAASERQPLIHGVSEQSDIEHQSVRNPSDSSNLSTRNPYMEIGRWRNRHGNCVVTECGYIMQPSLVGSLEYTWHRRLADRSQRPGETSLPEDSYGRGQSQESRHPAWPALEGDCIGPEAQHTTLTAKVASTLFPSLQRLRTRRSWHAVFNLISAIPFFLLRITVPLVDDAHGEHSDECGHGWDRWLLILQVFAATQLVWTIYWLSSDEPVQNHHWGVCALYLLAGSVVLCVAILISSNSRSQPKWYKVISVAGFVMSTFWLSIIADEVVSILKAAGTFMGISQAILGFTVFALGNSVDDFVANISVARHGHPIMGLSACFGGPLLSILLGLGPSIIFVTCRDAKRTGTLRPISVRVVKALIISSAVLAATMLFLIGTLRLNQWRMTKTIGSILVATWIVLTAVNLILELV